MTVRIGSEGLVSAQETRSWRAPSIFSLYLFTISAAGLAVLVALALGAWDVAQPACRLPNLT